MSSDDVANNHKVWLSTLQGNIPQASKDAIATWYAMTIGEGGFARSVARRLRITEATVCDRTEEPGKKEMRLVFETDVEQDMLNYMDSMHGGCAAFLIDLCSSMALTLLSIQIAPERSRHVSLVLNTVYHAPAPVGCRLKIVNTTIVLGNRVLTARTEIFDKTHNRLVASGVHVKMAPSTAKL